MELTGWLWLATAAYALHALEEHILDWRDWARQVIGLPVEWSDFYVTNFVVIVLGVTAANLAVVAPSVALGFAAVMVINAIFFHLLQMVRTRGRFSPGTFTAVVLMLPVAVACFRAGPTGVRPVVVAFVIGALLMALPIVLLKLKTRPYFRQ